MTTATCDATNPTFGVAHHALAGTAAPASGAIPALSSGLFAGPFSLVGPDAVLIDSAPGIELHVRKGSLWLTETWIDRHHYLPTGSAFMATEQGPLMLSRVMRAELAFVHPT